MVEAGHKPSSDSGEGSTSDHHTAPSTLAAVLVGSVLAVSLGWLGWGFVVLYLTMFAGVDDAAELLGLMQSQAMMFRLLPATFLVVLAAILLAGRWFRSHPWWVALGIPVLTALSMTSPFRFLPSIHGNYLPIAAAAAVGALLLTRRSGEAVPKDDRKENGS